MKEQTRRGTIIVIVLIIALALTACSRKTSSNIYWTDQYGEQVPIVVTVEGQDTVYDF